MIKWSRQCSGKRVEMRQAWACEPASGTCRRRLPATRNAHGTVQVAAGTGPRCAGEGRGISHSYDYGFPTPVAPPRCRDNRGPSRRLA